jgi:two-component sensor histidine kinase
MGQDQANIQSYLVAALERSGLCITIQNADREYLYVANRLAESEIPADGSPTDESLFGSEIAERLGELKDDAIAEEGIKQAEILTSDERSLDFTVELIGDDKSPLILTRVLDLSEKRTAERVTKALLREVSHRSKNLLAIIQSLASQTARTSGTISGFTEKFRGRLHALSQAQDLITDSSWRGAMLQQLLHDQVERYLPDARQCEFKGDDVRLAPNISMHLGLALHELVMKATDVLAYAADEAVVKVLSEKTTMAGKPALKLTWSMPEDDDIAATGAEAEAQDFSQVLLEKVVPASVQGNANYTHTNGNLVYTIKFPLTELIDNGDQ